MSELDLIPSSWRERRRTRRSLARFAVAYALVLILLAAAWMSLGARIEAEAAELDRLRDDRTAALDQRARLDRLAQREQELERVLKALDRLGGSADLARVFTAVDRSLGGDVWFRDWVFMRAGEFVDVEERTVDAGYLILVPEQAAGARKRAWQLRTHMEIRGQALTHMALAEFVRRLNAQPAVQAVTIVDTRRQRVAETDVVNFELAVVVRDPESAS